MKQYVEEMGRLVQLYKENQNSAEGLPKQTIPVEKINFDYIFYHIDLKQLETFFEEYPLIMERAEQLILETVREVWADVIADELYKKSENKADYAEKNALFSAVMELSAFSEDAFDCILKKKISVNIGMDTGDINYDYAANTVYPAYDPQYNLEEVADDASIVWLTRQQGHKIGELYFALDHIKHESGRIRTEFMKSIAKEVWHVSGTSNQLFFFASMSVYDMLLLNALRVWSDVTRHWGGYLLLDEDVAVGLFDSSVGGRSLLDIRLEKEIKVPMKYIAEIYPNHSYRYDINSERLYPLSKIFSQPDCDTCDNYWYDDMITYVSFPKKFRKIMEECGFSPIKKNLRRDIDTD